MKRLIKKIKIEYTIKLLTGLHIGGSKENVEIGGIDLPVIKIATNNNQPYIPGSSLRGKMRCLLEQADGVDTVGGSPEVNSLFGFTGNDDAENIPSRLIVRDAMLTQNSLNLFAKSEFLDMPYTENKFENSINRLTGKANNGIRQIERVPAGAEFNAEFIINVFEDEDEKTLREILEEGINLLQNDYLGGSGSRGYGQVEFKKQEEIEFTAENNWKKPEKVESSKTNSL